jgi:hypothetical protein
MYNCNIGTSDILDLRFADLEGVQAVLPQRPTESSGKPISRAVTSNTKDTTTPKAPKTSYDGRYEEATPEVLQNITNNAMYDVALDKFQAVMYTLST